MGEKFHGKEKILDLIFEVSGIFIMSLGIIAFWCRRILRRAVFRVWRF